MSVSTGLIATAVGSLVAIGPGGVVVLEPLFRRDGVGGNTAVPTIHLALLAG